MNFLDVILIILLGIAAIRGLKRGLILELATLVALVLGILAGFYLSGFVSGLLEKGFDYHGKYINIISFIIVFIAVIVLVRLLAKVIEKAVKAIALGFLNKLGGAIFSVLKTAFILSTMIYFLNRFDEGQRFIKPETRSRSFLFPVVEKLAPAIIPKMKQEIDDLRGIRQKEEEEG
jgi:membrane protein required for colicin V production